MTMTRAYHLILVVVLSHLCCLFQVGIASFKTEFGEDVSEADLIAKVEELNADPKVHGTYRECQRT